MVPPAPRTEPRSGPKTLHAAPSSVPAYTLPAHGTGIDWRRRHVTPYLTPASPATGTGIAALAEASRATFLAPRTASSDGTDSKGRTGDLWVVEVPNARALRTREALPCLWSRPQISRPASPATLQVPNAVLFGAKRGTMGRISDQKWPPLHMRPYASTWPSVSASRTLATACGSYARALGFTQVPPSLVAERGVIVTPMAMRHIPGTGLPTRRRAPLRRDRANIIYTPSSPPRWSSSGAPRPSRHARSAVRGASGPSHHPQLPPGSLALAAAHKYGLRLRTLSARQVHRAATQHLSHSPPMTPSVSHPAPSSLGPSAPRLTGRTAPQARAVRPRQRRPAR